MFKAFFYFDCYLCIHLFYGIKFQQWIDERELCDILKFDEIVAHFFFERKNFCV